MLKGHLKVARPQRPQSFWDCLHVPQSITTTNSCVVIKLDEENFYRVDRECWRTICLR